jgi:DNA-binding XRE family transcriptional regulator
MSEILAGKYLKILENVAAPWLATPMAAANSPQTFPYLTPQILAGRTLRMMREAHGVKLRELADLVGISPSHLSRVESGERAAGVDLTDRICEVIANLPAPEKTA